MPEIVFKLLPGKTIHAVVQDENATPISGVRVVLEGNGMDDAGHTYEFSATTDTNGYFEWDGTPDTPMPFSFGKQGYEYKRDVKLTPGQDNVVTLNHPRQLQGTVLDADTGAPITKFTVRAGRHQAGQSDVYGVISYQEFNSQDGTFKLDLNEEEDNAVEVFGDDYAEKIQDFPQAQNGIIQVTIQLKRSEALQGIVEGPDGTPLPGVNIAAAQSSGGGFVSLAGGHLRSWNQQSKVITSDADGKFSVPAPSDNSTIVAAGDFGFASAPLAQVRSSGIIILQPWGAIEGVLEIGGQPASGKDLMLGLQIPGLGIDYNSYKRTTDDQGDFTFDKVPPGDITINRLIQNSPNSWMNSYGKDVHVDPEQTVQVTLGDSGAIIQGTVRFDTPPADDEKLFISGSLSSQMPNRPTFNSPQEAQAYYQSPEGQAQVKQMKNFAFVVGADNSFIIDSVPSGVYSLNIMATKQSSQPWAGSLLAQGQMTITIPDDANPSSPISIGEIVLKANKQN